MTTFILIFILTFASCLFMGAPAMQRARQGLGGKAGESPDRRLRGVALGLVAVTLVAAHMAHQTQAPYAPTASGQDELAWVAGHATEQAE